MLISLNWLRELVAVTLPPEALANRLTMAGFEVEEIRDRRQLADGVVVGRVLQRQAHPNADKLSVCTVDLGREEPATIVCGASNVRTDILVPVAPPGTYLPTIDLKLKPAKLRGVKSEGMICSLAELGLETKSEGIHIFDDASLEPGTDVRPLLGLDDIVLDLTSTANRADALSMVGIARETAALTGAMLNLPAIQPQPLASQPALTVNVSDATACPTYIGTVLENVKIAPSPAWLQQRLQAAGVRPINNVVDITNYVLLEWGQPLHAFDRDRLQAVTGRENLAIGVRLAKAGETLQTLDDRDRALTEQNLLITANDQPVALAGVMGGASTEVNAATVNVMLEAALFDPVAIRRSARAQGLRTEASARYERGVNQAELALANDRAIALMVELAGAQPTMQAIADARPPADRWTRRLELRLARVQQILGPVKTEAGPGQLTAADVERTLTALNCQLTPVAGSETVWTVEIPSYRYRDLEREIDLIEEVARLYGYDRFYETLPSKTAPGALSPQVQVRNRVRAALRAVGLTELIHYSLVKPELADIRLENPLLSEYAALRRDLLDGVLDALAYNLSQGNGVLNGFEIGKVFYTPADGAFQEREVIAAVFGGDRQPQGRWSTGGKPVPMDWYEAKGLLESAFARLGLEVDYQPDPSEPRLHPGRTAALWLNGEQLGRFGQLHPQLRRDRDFPDAVYALQLEAGLLYDQIAALGTVHFAAYSPYPAVERDLAFFAPIDLAVSELTRAMQTAGKPLLAAIELFDRYQGENVPAGQRSLAFSLSYRAVDRTLAEADVEPVHQKVRDKLVQQFPVTLRS
ncbi:MAG: phenylalanine--tRNA ligase subunit beta [Spirulinaceae cyanobacterium SM2_1_0]|nr:phenylalanine--tRNA ligase subunit beta [Spirulinaceae cyanobacterium SM2_1_0]